MSDITFEDVTNINNTGVFDKLMVSVNSHINTQYEANRITGSDYATVYLGSLQSAMSQSVQFVLSEQLTETQVAGLIVDNLIKAEQLEKAQEEVKLLYTERVLKDKQVAKLGLDNAMKLSEEARTADINFVYLPNYYV
jgi:hypothetical protein